jgi:hypothetical protein
MGILEYQGRGAISQNAVPELTSCLGKFSRQVYRQVPPEPNPKFSTAQINGDCSTERRRPWFRRAPEAIA